MIVKVNINNGNIVSGVFKRTLEDIINITTDVFVMRKNYDEYYVSKPDLELELTLEDLLKLSNNCVSTSIINGTVYLEE